MTVGQLIEKVKLSKNMNEELKSQLVEKIPYIPMEELTKLATMLIWTEDDTSTSEHDAFTATLANAFSAMNNQATKEGIKSLYKSRRETQ